MGSFVDARLAQTPVWLGGVQGEGYQRALGGQQDDELALLKGAVRVRWPHPIGPLDALGVQGQDRRILRAPGESDEDYAARLLNAPELWYWAGTGSGLANIFNPFAPEGTATPPVGYALRLDRVQSEELIRARIARGEKTPEIVDVHTPGSSTFARFYCNHEWSGFWFGVDWFSLVYGLIDSTEGPWGAPADWDDPDYIWDEDDHLWGTTMTGAEAKYIRLSIRRMKGVDAYPVTIAVAIQRMIFWDPVDLVWDDGTNWPEEPFIEPFYLTIGHVWQEYEWLGDDIDYNWDGDGLEWGDFVNPLAA